MKASNKCMAVGWLMMYGTVVASAHCFAYEAGDWIVRAGVASVQPNEDSSALSLNGSDLGGTRAGVDNNSQLGLTATYMLTANLGVGVLAATPFEHDIQAKGLGVKGGEVKHLPPTLTLQYFPCDSDAAVQLYIGAGINYTTFFSAEVDPGLATALGSSGSLELDNSVGWAAQAGVDYALSEHWLINASLWYLDIDTDAQFRFASGDRVSAGVDIDPWVYMVGLGYRF